MGDTQGGEFDAKRFRLEENPSGWIKLTRYEAVRLMIDALLEAPPGHQFNKSELARRAGISRNSVRDRLPVLVELGIVEEIGGESTSEYRLNERGKVTTELMELNSAANSVLSGEPKNVKTASQLNGFEFETTSGNDDSNPFVRAAVNAESPRTIPDQFDPRSMSNS